MAELKLQMDFNKWLKKEGIPFYHIEKGRTRGMPKVHRKAWPDNFIFLPKGKTLFVELKDRGKPQTPDQKDKMQDLFHMGFPCLCTDNLSQAIWFVESNFFYTGII